VPEVGAHHRAAEADAVLGDPIELEVRGYRLSLRKSEARRVAVELVGA